MMIVIIKQKNKQKLNQDLANVNWNDFVFESDMI